MADIEKLKKLIDPMTGGPWSYYDDGALVLGGDGHMVAQVRGYGAEVSGQRPKGTQDANGAGVVALRNLAPELLAVAEAARGKNECVCDEAWGAGRHTTSCPRYWNESTAAALDALDAKLREVLP